MTRLAVLASGTGSLFAAMLEQKIPVALLVADRPCKALQIARDAGIPYQLLPRTFGPHFNRSLYTRLMLDVLRSREIDLVAMAGFMTIFSHELFERSAYQLKVLNTHPSLLPAFKGDHAVRDAIAYGVKVSGCTIHWATADLDAGPIIAQEPVHVHSSDTEESLHERIKVVERRIYPEVLRVLMTP